MKVKISPTGVTWISIAVMALVIVGFIGYVVLVYFKTPDGYIGL